MIINVNENWRIKSDVRSWQVEEFCGEKRKVWRPLAWVDTLDQAKRRLIGHEVEPDDLSAVEETLDCKDPFDPDGERGFCWQFDEVFPAGSPDARSLAKMTIPIRRVRDGLEPEPVGNPGSEEKTRLEDEDRLEWGAGGRFLMPVSDQWRIREDTLDWYVEKYHRFPKGSCWKPEAYCINLLDAMKTLLQRRVWLIESDDPARISAAERNSLDSRRFCVVMVCLPFT